MGRLAAPSTRAISTASSIMDSGSTVCEVLPTLRYPICPYLGYVYPLHRFDEERRPVGPRAGAAGVLAKAKHDALLRRFYDIDPGHGPRDNERRDDYQTKPPRAEVGKPSPRGSRGVGA